MMIGDVVRLNSGSPKLSVVGVIETHATVCWVSDGNITRATFPLVCLTTIEKNKSHWKEQYEG
jgi:uncharacterized protein YodC (DUF2158 family)